MLIDSACSATLNQDMFWHGLSLVSSRVKGVFIMSMVIQREKNIGQFDFVLGDDRHHRSMDQAVDSLWVKLCS